MEFVPRLFGKKVFNHLALAFGHLLLALQLRVGRVQSAAREHGVAAQEAHLFEHHDLAARAGRRNGRRHAGAAAAHDHDVGLGIGRDLDDVADRVALHEFRGIKAGLLYGVTNGAEDGEAREGRAAHAVDLERLVLHDRFGNPGERLFRNRRRFKRLNDLDVRDAVLFDRHVDDDFVVVAHGRAAEGSVGRIGAARDRGGGEHRKGREANVFHEASPLVECVGSDRYA